MGEDSLANAEDREEIGVKGVLYGIQRDIDNRACESTARKLECNQDARGSIAESREGKYLDNWLLRY